MYLYYSNFSRPAIRQMSLQQPKYVYCMYVCVVVRRTCIMYMVVSLEALYVHCTSDIYTFLFRKPSLRCT